MVTNGKYEYKGFTISVGQMCVAIYSSGWTNGVIVPTEKEAREWIDDYLEKEE